MAHQPSWLRRRAERATGEVVPARAVVSAYTSEHVITVRGLDHDVSCTVFAGIVSCNCGAAAAVVARCECGHVAARHWHQGNCSSCPCRNFAASGQDGETT